MEDVLQRTEQRIVVVGRIVAHSAHPKARDHDCGDLTTAWIGTTAARYPSGTAVVLIPRDDDGVIALRP